MPFTFEPTEVPGVVLCAHRETRADLYRAGGIAETFVQDNRSLSARGVLRGLHFQLRKPQAKLVSCIRGEIFDVAVDVRRGSPTFGRWSGARLGEENHHQLFIPRGFAHGFCVLSEVAEILYKCTDYYDPSDDRGVLWSDPALGIAWPLEDQPLLSAKDAAQPLLRDAELPAYAEGA